MFTLLAYTLINEVRNLGWNQRVLNLLILSGRENTQKPGCVPTHALVGQLRLRSTGCLSNTVLHCLYSLSCSRKGGKVTETEKNHLHKIQIKRIVYGSLKHIMSLALLCCVLLQLD